MEICVLEKDKMVGVVGGGQLGMFFTQSAQSLGYRVCCFCNQPDEPAARYADEVITGSFDDAACIDRLTRMCEVVTYEFESIPAATLAAIADKVQLRPSLSVVQTTQNRALEKQFLADNGIPTSPFAIVDSLETLVAGVRQLDGAAVLKTATDGYDGKGQWKIDSGADRSRLEAIHQEVAGRTCTLEKFVDLAFEVSMLVAGDVAGDFVTIGPMRNRHVNHILDTSWVANDVDPQVEATVRELATRVARDFALVGIFCVEFFVGKTGEVLVNEIAPRPHNSGHLTIDSFSQSQFDLQALAVTSHELPQPKQARPAVMVNLLGDLWAEGEPEFESIGDSLPGTQMRLHLYGKATARPGRKMGHATFIGDDLQTVIRNADQFRAQLGMEAPTELNQV